MAQINNENKLLEISKPADFSYKNIKVLTVGIGPESARSSRLGTVPERGEKNNKFLTRSIWLNNNKLKTTKDMDTFVQNVLEYPEQLCWMDFSFNYITEIDQDSLLKYPHIKILYLHGNCIDDLEEILKLRKLKELRTLTLHGNPISNHRNYRNYVIAALPQIINLDFTRVLTEDKTVPAPPELLRKMRELKL